MHKKLLKDKLMGNKKSQEFLGEHVTNIVIAAISIVVLIFLGVSIYNIFLGQKVSLEKAKFSLDQIMEKVDSLDSSKTSASQNLVNPEKWAVIGWTKVNNLPGVCADSDCICICDISGWTKTTAFSTLEDKSAKKEICIDARKGICAPVKYALESDTLNYIDSPIELNFNLENNKIKITSKK